MYTLRCELMKEILIRLKKGSGIRSIRETQIMTPAAKAKEAIKIPSPFSFFLKISKEPSMVEVPAKNVIKKEVENMLSPVQAYGKKGKIYLFK